MKTRRSLELKIPSVGLFKDSILCSKFYVLKRTVEDHSGYQLWPPCAEGATSPLPPQGVWVGLSPQGRGLLPPLAQQLRWQRVRKENLNPSESTPLRCRTTLELPEKRLSLSATEICDYSSWWLFLPLLGASLPANQPTGKGRARHEETDTADTVRAAGCGHRLQQHP